MVWWWYDDGLMTETCCQKVEKLNIVVIDWKNIGGIFIIVYQFYNTTGYPLQKLYIFDWCEFSLRIILTESKHVGVLASLL